MKIICRFISRHVDPRPPRVGGKQPLRRSRLHATRYQVRARSSTSTPYVSKSSNCSVSASVNLRAWSAFVGAFGNSGKVPG